MPAFVARNYRTGQRTAFDLVGSHTSTVQQGHKPYPKPDCTGCQREHHAR